MTRTVAALIAMLVGIMPLGLAEAEDVYKYKDAQGHLVYTDQRPTGPAERVTVDSASKPTTQDVTRSRAQREAADRMVAESLQRDKTRVAAEAAANAERAKQCSAARSENARFAYGGRLYQIDPQGNRVYYSAQEIDAHRAAAARAMAEFCPPVKSK